jgi:Fe-S cluster assembly scaffold protein SufB
MDNCAASSRTDDFPRVKTEVIRVSDVQRIIDSAPLSSTSNFILTSGAKAFYLLDLCSEDTSVQLSRNITFKICGPGVSAELYILLRGSGTQVLSINLNLLHETPLTTSKTHICAIADDSARINVFSRIYIARDAIACAANLQNHNLLMSNDATIETTPILDIRSHDVSCSHGATVSGPRPEEIFYLQSRGICKNSAKKLFRDAFAQRILAFYDNSNC